MPRKRKKVEEKPVHPAPSRVDRTPPAPPSGAGGAGGEPEEIRRQWQEFVATGSREARDRLIEHYYPLVCQAAERMKAKLPALVEIDDLKQAGALGLIDAIEKFDPSREIKFETYCTVRISGAMYDDLRRCDWVPRQIRNRGHQIQRARDELEIRLQRVASEEELAAHLDKTPEEFASLVREQQVHNIVSLDRKWEDERDTVRNRLEMLTDIRADSPLDALQRSELKNLAYRGLSQKEKAILQMYYYDNMSLKEIGLVLDISESRVCQIHQQTIERIREKFVAREVQPL
ncbi:MAG: FliA/WhiG family RNA polymerase sigma factor [Planctomycetota bacterium]